MALFRIDKFVGVNVNVESGEGVTSPTSVKGFLFDRTGGFIARYGTASTGATNWGPLGSLGYSPDGLAAYQSGASGAGQAFLYDGTTIHSSSAARGLGGTTAYFVPGAGVTAIGVTAVLIKDTSGTIRNGFVASSMTIAAVSGGAMSSGSWFVSAMRCYPTKAGLLHYFPGSQASLSVGGGPGSNAISVSIASFEGGAQALIYYGQGSTSSDPKTTHGYLAGVLTPSAPSLKIVANTGGPAYADNLVYEIPQFSDGVNEVHNQRVWGTIEASQVIYQPNSYSPLSTYAGAVTLVYTEIGWANVALNNNWLKLPVRSSSIITGLRSSPAGLLVFGDKETFLVRGDPANASTFSVQLVSGEIGHDSGAEQPGVLGGAVFPIYNGRIYEMVFGMGDVDFGTGIKEIGYNVWDGSDGFVQVVGEPRRNQLVARTTSGKVYRYDLHEKQWFDDPLTGVSLTRMLPSPDSHGTRYLRSSNSVLSTVESGSASPSVSWTGLDMGDRGIKKHWRRVRIFTGSSYSGTPTLTYSISGSSGTISGTDNGGGRFVFVLPQGIVGERGDLTVALAGASVGDQLKAPVEVEFNARYRQR